MKKILLILVAAAMIASTGMSATIAEHFGARELESTMRLEVKYVIGFVIGNIYARRFASNDGPKCRWDEAAVSGIYSSAKEQMREADSEWANEPGSLEAELHWAVTRYCADQMP